MRVEVTGGDKIVICDIKDSDELCCLLEEVRMTIEFLDLLSGLEDID
jgi:hypothetical protein